VFAVPKTLPEHYKFGFILEDAGAPFFQDWEAGMKAAAKFYGVTMIFADQGGGQPPHDERLPGLFTTLHLQGINLIGSQRTTPALQDAAKTAGLPLIGLDASELLPGMLHLGVQGTVAGELAGEYLGPIAKQKLAGPWKGKTLYYVELSDATCDPCVQRVAGGLAGLRKYVSVPTSHVLVGNEAVQPEGDLSYTTNVLTAHPNSVFVIIGLDDESELGGMEALAQAKRVSDGIGVSLGCDQTGIKAIQSGTFTGALVSCLNFSPYAEGWAWVEAAIATVLHKPFGNYDVTQFVTPATLKSVFPTGNQPGS
jgi:ABC-type sugar transport system substrate-binding protein